VDAAADPSAVVGSPRSAGHLFSEATRLRSSAPLNNGRFLRGGALRAATDRFRCHPDDRESPRPGAEAHLQAPWVGVLLASSRFIDEAEQPAFWPWHGGSGRRLCARFQSGVPGIAPPPGGSWAEAATGISQRASLPGRE